MKLTRPHRNEKLFRTLLWTGIAILIITLFVSTFLRVTGISEFYRTGNYPPPNAIEYGYARNPLLTLLHILPGAFFIVLGAMQFMRPLRQHYPAIHRRTGRIYIVIGFLVGITALIMSVQIAFGGIVESAAVIPFGSFFLYSLARAYRHIRRKQYDDHREWMIRAYSIGIAVATMRPLIGLFFAFTSLPFNKFFGPCFWMAFILHSIVAEWWIRYTRPSQKKQI